MAENKIEEDLGPRIIIWRESPIDLKHQFLGSKRMRNEILLRLSCFTLLGLFVFTTSVILAIDLASEGNSLENLCF